MKKKLVLSSMLNSSNLLKKYVFESIPSTNPEFFGSKLVLILSMPNQPGYGD